VNEEVQRQEIERENNDNKIRNRMESRTHGMILVTEEDGSWLIAPNKAKYDRNDEVLKKELRFLHVEEDERFVKGWFCFRFIGPTKSNPKVKASKITEIQKVQRILHRKLQKEFRRKARNTKKYLDGMVKEEQKRDKRNMEIRKRNEASKLKRMKKQKQKELRFNQQREAAAAEAERWEMKKIEERQRKLQEKYQRLKQDREQQQQRKQKQQKKQQMKDDDDDTVKTEITQESSVASEELECHLVNDEDDTNNNNIVIIPTQVLFKMNDTTLNWK